MNLGTNFSLDLPFEKQTPFLCARHATIGCGGQAPVGYFPDTEETLIRIAEVCENKEYPYVVVGNMSNVLPADGRIDKIVVSTKKFQDWRFDATGVYVSAGLSAGSLLRACEEEGRTGAEFLSDIPCTLGGALYMNAGVAGEYLSELVSYVKVWYKGKMLLLNVNECEYAYKTSVFMREDMWILGAKLLLSKGSKEYIQAKKNAYKTRRQHLPKGKSMGCVFKNPEGKVAGKLIESAGLKGLRIGGAVVSLEHANFIINDRGATAAQIRELIGLIKGAVYKQYGVQLQEEIRYIY